MGWYLTPVFGPTSLGDAPEDCDRNGDRMSKNDEKLTYLNWVTKKYFLLVKENKGLCLKKKE